MSDPISLNLKKNIGLGIHGSSETELGDDSAVTGEAPEKLDPDFSLQDICQMKIG